MLRLWNIEDGQQIRLFKGHTNWVTSVAVSADGRRALSGSADKTLRLWDIAKGESLKTLPARAWINAVALSANGARAVSGNADHSVILWDLNAGKPVHQFAGHGGEVTCVAITGDGKFALSGSADGSIFLWDLEQRRQVAEVKHNTAVAAVAFAPDSRRFLWCGEDRVIHLWSRSARAEVMRYEGHTQRITALALSADGFVLLSAGADRSLRAWDIVTGQEVGHAELPGSQIGCVAISADGLLALSGGEDTLVRSWKVPALPRASPATTVPGVAELTRLPWRNDGKNIEFFVPLADGKLFVTAEGDRLHVRELETGKDVVTCQGHKGVIADVAVSSDGRRAFTVSAADRSFRFWDLETGEELQSRQCKRAPAGPLALSSSGALALYVDEEDRAIVLWDTERGTAIGRLTEHVGDVVSLAVSPDGRRVLSATRDGNAVLWDCATTRPLKRFAGLFQDRHCVAFGVDGKQVVLLSGAPADFLAVWDIEAGRMTRYLGHADAGFVSLKVSPSGRLALTSNRYGNLRLWNLAGGEEVCIFKGHTRPPLGFGFSPDGATVISGDHEARLRTWAVPLKDE
jgi:WD40 repeat protein